MLSSRVIAAIVLPKGRIILSSAAKATAVRFASSTAVTPSPSQQKALMKRKKVPKAMESLEPIVPEYEPPATHDEHRIDEVFARIDRMPLPTTMDEALGTKMSHRPIIVTEKTPPFRIVGVNDAWEDLCGYTNEEAKGKRIGELLHGPETDQGATTALLSQLLHGEEAATVLTNYTKSGRKFQNRVRLGPIKDEKTSKISHYVGVLHEIEESSDFFIDWNAMKSNMYINLGPI